MLRRLDQQAGDRVVHFGRFNRGEAEADFRDGGDECLEELAQARLTPGRWPGVPANRVLPWVAPGRRPGGSRASLAVGADMHAGEYDLGVVFGERLRLADELGNRPRPVRPAGERRRAEGAVLVAAVLDLEPAARIRLEAAELRIDARGGVAGGAEHRDGIGPRHHGADRGEARDATVVERGGAAHDHSLERPRSTTRSEEHTSELRSRLHLVCRLLLEKKKMTRTKG